MCPAGMFASQCQPSRTTDTKMSGATGDQTHGKVTTIRGKQLEFKLEKAILRLADSDLKKQVI